MKVNEIEIGGIYRIGACRGHTLVKLEEIEMREGVNHYHFTRLETGGKFVLSMMVAELLTPIRDEKGNIRKEVLQLPDDICEYQLQESDGRSSYRPRPKFTCRFCGGGLPHATEEDRDRCLSSRAR